MSVSVETADSALAIKKETEAERREEVRIIGFDAERFRAPFVLRCAALFLDYLALMAAPVVALMSASGQASGVKMFKSETLTIGWLVALLVLVTNFVVLPLVSGRTLGKFMMGLRIVQTNGDDLSFSRALIRQLAGYALTILTLGLGFLLAIFNAKGRALHDFLAGTIVVQGTRRKNSPKSKV